MRVGPTALNATFSHVASTVPSSPPCSRTSLESALNARTSLAVAMSGPLRLSFRAAALAAPIPEAGR